MNPTWKFAGITFGLLILMSTVGWLVGRFSEARGDSGIIDISRYGTILILIFLLLLLIYLVFSAALGVDVEEEWASWEYKQYCFRHLVDDLAVDEEDFGQYSPAEQLHLAHYITFFQRGTFRSTRDAKKLARELAEQRGILQQYESSTVPKVEDWPVRSNQWAVRTERRYLEQRRSERDG